MISSSQSAQSALVHLVGVCLLSCSIATGSLDKGFTIQKLEGPLRIFPSLDGETKVDYILSRLSKEELEDAALASYEYLRLKVPTGLERIHHARKIARKYLNSKKEVEKTIKKLKETLKFRRDLDIVGLMTAFEPNTRNNYSMKLYKQLSCKKLYVQGYDRKGRSTLFFIPRLVKGHDSEWTVKEAIYSIERAIACTKSKDGLINAIVDFAGCSITKHSPPIDIAKDFLTTLRNHYAGQIHRIYIIDTPPAFSFFWNIVKPFVGSQTRAKIQFLSGKGKVILKNSYSVDEAPSWMIPGGKKNRSLDLDSYLFDTPFHEAFDEEKKLP